jgi:hypothetical protein
MNIIKFRLIISSRQRNYAAAEFQWYERYIRPKLKRQPDLEELSESIIEEIID